MKADAIVPIYNEEKNVENVVKTLLESDLFENIICVNDGSSDNSLKVLESLGNKIKLISYHENKGKGNALAEGIVASDSEIIHFTDADIIGLTKENLGSMVKPLINEGFDVVIGTKDDSMLKISSKASSAISGQRTYFRKDLIPLIPVMKTKRFGVEIFLNEIFRGKKIKYIHIEGAYHLKKYEKSGNLSDAIKEHIKEGYEVGKEIGNVSSAKVTKKIKKFLIPILVLFLLGEVSFAQTIESITSFKSDVSINSDGTIDVIENISYYFPDERHGIIRQIPLGKVNEDKKKFVMEVSNTEVMMDDVRVNFQDNSSSKELNLKIGDANTTITGNHTYEIKYSLGGALTYFSDHDELYWNVTGDEWVVPIESAQTVVHLDAESPEFFEAVCYTGGYGSLGQDCTETKTSPDSISINTTQPLGAYEGLTMVVRFPRGLVAVLEPKADNSDLIIGILYLLYAVALPGYLIIRAIKIHKKLPEEKMVVSAWFDPPKTPSKRFLTAGETGTLIDKRVDIRDISGTLIQLAQKGFIKIREEDKKTGILIKKPIFTFIKEKEWEDSKLMPHEINLLDIIFSGSDEVSTEQIGKRIGFSGKLNSVMKDIASQLVDEKLLLSNVISNRDTWAAIAVLSIFFFNPLLIVAALLNMYAVRRTSAGGDAIAKAKSLKNFIVTQDEQYKFQAENKMMFEKLLPYAVAFGVEKIWIDRFKDLIKSPPDWYQGSSRGVFNYALMSSSFNDSFRGATQMSSHRSSSGFSSGFSGGFSGGGGGGGGGGSW